MPPARRGRGQVDQLATGCPERSGRGEPHRSFLNLAEGKVFCVMEAPSKDALAVWFNKMQMPCDSITPVELEGERGAVKET